MITTLEGLKVGETRVIYLKTHQIGTITGLHPAGPGARYDAIDILWDHGRESLMLSLTETDDCGLIIGDFVQIGQMRKGEFDDALQRRQSASVWLQNYNEKGMIDVFVTLKSIIDAKP